MTPCFLPSALRIVIRVARVPQVHRDLKPEHVLCTYGSVCLLDFVESALKSENNLNHR